MPIFGPVMAMVLHEAIAVSASDTLLHPHTFSNRLNSLPCMWPLRLLIIRERRGKFGGNVGIGEVWCCKQGLLVSRNPTFSLIVPPDLASPSSTSTHYRSSPPKADALAPRFSLFWQSSVFDYNPITFVFLASMMGLGGRWYRRIHYRIVYPKRTWQHWGRISNLKWGIETDFEVEVVGILRI